MKTNQFSVLVGGEAGFGIMTTGLLFSKLCARLGLYPVAVADYPSLIRGGHNYQTIRVEDQPVHMTLKRVDCVIALNKETFDLHKGELMDGGAIIYDKEDVPDAHADGVQLFQVPMNQIARDLKGPKFIINSVSLGAVVGLLKLDFSVLDNLLRDYYKKKGSDVIAMNVEAARRGYDVAKSQYAGGYEYQLTFSRSSGRKLIISGNEAASYGAIKAGLKFYAAYPMTPASSLLSIFAAHEREYDMVVKQSEDEIAAMNMIIGGAYTGARSMTGTSGGGFCLMTEALSMAGLSEVPLVCLLAMRSGPSTGLPTMTEAGELLFVLHAGHGEFPRIVIAFGDAEEAFFETFNAFNYAERYQTPVIVLTDKHLGEGTFCVDWFDTSKLKIDRGMLLSDDEAARQRDFKRYQITDNGISPRAIPGQPNCINKGTSYEHDEYGYTTEDVGLRIRQVDKRARKLQLAERELESKGYTLHGSEKADLTVVSWGSTKGAILDAMKILAKEGKKVNFLQIKYFSPFPVSSVERILKSAKKVLLIENNATAQAGQVIRMKTGIDIKDQMLLYTGKALAIEDVIDRIRGVV